MNGDGWWKHMKFYDFLYDELDNYNRDNPKRELYWQQLLERINIILENNEW